MQNWRRWFGELVFPPFCLSCHRLGKFLCDECYEQLQFLSLPIQIHLEPLYLDELYAAVQYSPPITDLIHAMKYDGVSRLAEYCGQFLYQSVNIPVIDCLTAVPLHPKRQRQRGFNQSEVMALEVAHAMQLPYANVLTRQRQTSPQASLTHKSDRLHHLDDAFTINTTFLHQTLPLPYTSVLLLDDVVTTGTTLNQCAKVLKQSGVQKVIGMVIAHGS